MLFDSLKYKKERTYRVIIHFHNGQSIGSGFFISKNKFLTCFHVVFGLGLRDIKRDPQFNAQAGTGEHAKLKSFFDHRINKVEIELKDGLRVEAQLKEFDEKYDIALLEVSEMGEEINICDLEFTPKLQYGDHVSFVGFPTHHDYALDKAPLAYQEGILSAFLETIIAGEKYKHLQINTINLGGNSGAPLFLKKGKKVIGIINGNMNWGNDSMAAVDGIDPGGNLKLKKISFRIPLSIAYATEIGLIKSQTKILEDFSSPKWSVREIMTKLKARLGKFRRH